jgi:hypothetical protein
VKLYKKALSGSEIEYRPSDHFLSARIDYVGLKGARVRERQQAAAGSVRIESTRLDTNPQYSPNGTRIAFTSE